MSYSVVVHIILIIFSLDLECFKHCWNQYIYKWTLRTPGYTLYKPGRLVTLQKCYKLQKIYEPELLSQ